MQIEVRLKKLLQDHGLERRRITQDIARDLGVHRHTIGKLYRNQLTNPSLKVLGDLCDWLRSHGVPAEKLPHALFGLRPSALWDAVAAPGAVTMYLGEYQEIESAVQQMLWISRRDVTVAGEIVQKLSTAPDGADAGEVSAGPGEATGRMSPRRQPTVRTEYVPFRFDARGTPAAAAARSADGDRTTQDFEHDKAQARRIFQQMRSEPAPRTSILIGSQRANYLLEHLVAGLFGCEPFVPVRGQVRVPFYLCYRDSDRAVPSCFGGPENPPDCKGPFQPGVMYLDGKGNWVRCPWDPPEDDAGVLILVRDPGTGAMEVAVFGFSGRGTEAMGWHLVHGADDFWPPYVVFKGKQIGVYVCRFKIGTGAGGAGAGGKPEGSLHARQPQVVKVEAKVLKKYLA